MKIIYRLYVLCLVLVMSNYAYGQRIVKIEASSDPASPTDIFPVIMGDTLDDGSRTDLSTIYQLENGQFYITTGRIVNRGYPLVIQAEDLANIDTKPVISRIPNDSGTYPDIMRPEADVTLENLWIISGETGPLEQHDWGKIRLSADSMRMVVNDCIIEKDRGGFLQVRANNTKIYVNRCTFRNGGNRRILQGNGRGIDARNFKLDTLIVKDSYIFNIQDRVFRSQGGTEPHNYIEFDHNTIFNVAGRHGAFQLGKAYTVKITNNLIKDPIMLGSSPIYTDEQTQPDNETHKVFTLDEVNDSTDLTFAANNIFWTQEVIDFYNSIDTVTQPAIYSQLIAEQLGADTATSYIQEVLELNNVPQSILQYAKDLYANPAADDMFDFIVEDASRAGTAFDNGNLFDFSTFDAGYDFNSISAGGATDGSAIGAANVQPPVSAEARIVKIEASADPANPADIFPVIMGDTLSNGLRTELNTIYVLENGQFYITSGRIVNRGWPLVIQAEDVSDLTNKPVISRIPNDSGAYPDIMRPEGNVTLLNLWIISGEKGPLEQHDWGKIRLSADDMRMIVEDCIIEKDRGGFLQVRANNTKIYVRRSILRNGGNRRILQGNGRGIDARNFKLDTLVVENSVIHNIQDRVFRSQGGTEPHNYIKFDHNTIFNVAGRHGAFQFGKANEVIITNNLIKDPIMLGTSPIYTDEQTQPDNEAHKVFTIDEINDNTSFTFAANNIFWTQEVIDFYNSIDTVAQPAIYSQLIAEQLGADTATSYIQEVLELNNVPGSILQYAIDLYANPAADDMFDFIVEDASRAGTAFDNGYLFDFAAFDACYDAAAQSTTAGTDGNPIGAYLLCSGGSGPVLGIGDEPEFTAMVYPNPSSGKINFSLAETNFAEVIIYNSIGQKVDSIKNKLNAAEVSWNNPTNSTGIHFYRIFSKDKLLAAGSIILLK